jgi:hypothetical protein
VKGSRQYKAKTSPPEASLVSVATDDWRLSVIHFSALSKKMHNENSGHWRKRAGDG